MGHLCLQRAFREDAVGEADDGANGDAGRGRREGSGDGAVDVVEGQAARRGVVTTYDSTTTNAHSGRESLYNY
jgi:hypothetical protein